MLLIRRAELLNKAENKLDFLCELVDAQDVIKHTLFYCAPGQIDEVLRLLGWEKGLLVHRFTAEEGPRERQQVANRFCQWRLAGIGGDEVPGRGGGRAQHAHCFHHGQ